MTFIKYGIWIGLLLVVTSVSAANSEVVELRYRSATEMSQVVKPHLQSGESVSGLDNKLILRLKPENRAAILSLIQQLDQRPNQLLVSVRQGGAQTGERNEAGVSGRYQTGKGNVQIGSDSRPLSGRVVQHQTKSDSGNTQQLRVMDGQRASFYIGQLVPVPGGSAMSADGFILHEGLYYQEVVNGFVVRPRVSGDVVRLEISPQQQNLQSDGRIAVQLANTVVQGRLGEWLDIGQVVEEISQTRTGLLSHSSLKSNNRSRVEVKVELAP